MNSELERIAAELASLREKTQPLDKDSEYKRLEREATLAKREANEAKKERDEAVAELAKVKADIQWMMGKLMMRDIMFKCGEDLPCAADGYLEAMFADPKDAKRLDWINRHGRLGFHSHNLLIALPHMIDTNDATVPEIYTIRHFIDLCMLSGKSKPPTTPAPSPSSPPSVASA